MAEVRLNKWIADSGLCSRREADRLIASGEVCVNGERVMALGVKIVPGRDEVRVSGRPLPRISRYYLLFHKPAGVITTRSDEKGRKTIYDVLPKKYHVCDPASRLDRESSGALLLSNDGDFVNRVTHPRYHLAKHYRVKVSSELTEKALEALSEGMELHPEGLAKADAISVVDACTVDMTLSTGFNRQIRRMFEALGYEVIRLRRTAIGEIALGDLPSGKTRNLLLEEIKAVGGWKKHGKPPAPPSKASSNAASGAARKRVGKRRG